MQDELNSAVAGYLSKWQTFIGARRNRQPFESFKPTAIGWKVTDRKEYHKLLADWHDECDKIIETWMNGRWVAKLHLKDTALPGGIKIIKLMERRSGSADAVGLDHLDFYSPDMTTATEVLEAETGIKWTHESNDVRDDYAWISIWFDGTEAKLKSDTVLSIIAAELKDIEAEILKENSPAG